MSTKATMINAELLSVLQTESFDDFTIIELRDLYMAECDILIDPIKARRFVYGQVLRFKKLGLLKVNKACNARESMYCKTPKFNTTNFMAKSHQSPQDKADLPPMDETNSLAEIKEQLKQYKIDLLASVGESEEYMRLYRSNPEFRALLEREYLQARDQSSKLLGQIKALKTVLHHYSN